MMIIVEWRGPSGQTDAQFLSMAARIVCMNITWNCCCIEEERISKRKKENTTDFHPSDRKLPCATNCRRLVILPGSLHRSGGVSGYYELCCLARQHSRRRKNKQSLEGPMKESFFFLFLDRKIIEISRPSSNHFVLEFKKNFLLSLQG